MLIFKCFSIMYNRMEIAINKIIAEKFLRAFLALFLGQEEKLFEKDDPFLFPLSELLSPLVNTDDDTGTEEEEDNVIDELNALARSIASDVVFQSDNINQLEGMDEQTLHETTGSISKLLLEAMGATLVALQLGIIAKEIFKEARIEEKRINLMQALESMAESAAKKCNNEYQQSRQNGHVAPLVPKR